MKFAPLVLAALGLSACSQAPTSPNAHPQLTRDDQKIVHAMLTLLASDGKPVCVERQTFGSPLSIFRIATQGNLQNVYSLAWYPPKPFRPPHMPTLTELRSAAKNSRDADLPEPAARTDAFPAARQAELNQSAMALAPPEVATHRVGISTTWAPAGVVPRWLPTNNAEYGCTAQYILSGVKLAPDIAFVAVRVDHWGTVYALVPQGESWKPVAQWGAWLY